MSEVCVAAAAWPVGTRVYCQINQKNGVVRSAADYVAQRTNMHRPSGDRVGSAFEGRDGGTYVAVQWDDSVLGPERIGSTKPQRLVRSVIQTLPTLYTQEQIVAAETRGYERGKRDAQNRSEEAYAAGVREGREQMRDKIRGIL